MSGLKLSPIDRFVPSEFVEGVLNAVVKDSDLSDVREGVETYCRLVREAGVLNDLESKPQEGLVLYVNFECYEKLGGTRDKRMRDLFGCYLDEELEVFALMLPKAEYCMASIMDFETISKEVIAVKIANNQFIYLDPENVYRIEGLANKGASLYQNPKYNWDLTQCIVN